MKQELRKQIAELSAVHKRLTQVVEQDGETLLSGVLEFEASAEGLETLTDSFVVELTIPCEFPEKLPLANETGGRIEADYDHLNPDGTLCLAVPIEQRRVFFEQPSLLGYVDRLLVPFLYGYCFWSKHGYHPFDEAAHGHEGILDHYIETLNLQDPIAALAVICFLFEYGYRGHHNCPCGSGRRVRICHGPALRSLHDHHTADTLQHDFLAILNSCLSEFDKGQLSLPRALQSQLVRLMKKVERKCKSQDRRFPA